MDPKENTPQDGGAMPNPAAPQPQQPQANPQPVQQQPVPQPDPAPVAAAQPQPAVAAPQPVAAPQQPAQQQNMGAFGHVGGAQHKKQKMIKMIIVIVLAVVAVAVMALVAQKLLSSGKIGALVEDSQSGISFMRPDNWIETESDDEFTYFTEGGENIDDVDLGLLLGTQNVGSSFAALSDSQKESIRESFETQFSSLGSTLTDGSCKELGEVTTSETQQTGYDLAFIISAQCKKLEGREVGGTVKMLLGWYETDLHVFGVVADDDTWESEKDKLNEIVDSVKPAS